MSSGIVRKLFTRSAQANRTQIDPSWEMLPKPPSAQPAAAERKLRGKRKFVSASLLQQNYEWGCLSSDTRLTGAASHFTYAFTFHACALA